MSKESMVLLVLAVVQVSLPKGSEVIKSLQGEQFILLHRLQTQHPKISSIHLIIFSSLSCGLNLGMRVLTRVHCSI